MRADPLPEIAGEKPTLLRSRGPWLHWANAHGLTGYNAVKEPEEFPCLAYLYTDPTETTFAGYIYARDAVALLSALVPAERPHLIGVKQRMAFRARRLAERRAAKKGKA